MNKQDLIRLNQIYNTLCLIETKGESSIYMGRSLEALKEFIVQKEQEILSAETNE